MLRLIKKTISNIHKNFKIGTYIYLAIFSILAAKSIFIKPFTLIKGFWGLLIGLLLVVILFIISSVLVYFVEKVSFKRIITPINKYRLFQYMVPGILVSTLLWLCNWPAIVPYDSAYIWHMTTEGAFNSMHPIVYTLAVLYSRMIWDSPAIFVLMQILFCFFVYAYVAYAFEKQGLNRKWCWVIAIVLAIIPVNAIHSVTWLKDVLYIMSLVFMSTILMECACNKKAKVRQIIILIIAGLIAILSRHNGILSIPLTFAFAAFTFLLMKNYKQVLSFTIALIIVVVGFFGIEKIAVHSIDGNYFPKATVSEYFTIPIGQTIYIISNHRNELNDKQLDDAEYYINMDYVNHIKNETPARWDFNLNLNASVKVDQISTTWRRFAKFYLSLAYDFPLTAIESYEKLTAIAWCTPEYGYTLSRNMGIASYMDEEMTDVASILPKLQEFLDKTILYPNKYTVFLWRPALPMLLIILLMLIAFRRHGKLSLIVASPAIFNMLGYMIVNPSQNVRYLYCNVSVFIIMLVFTLMIPYKENLQTQKETDENIKN